jgi:hypothetical protein
MELAVIKWRRIASEIIREGVSPQLRDDTSCMTKWNALYGDFKKIKDYHLALDRTYPTLRSPVRRRMRTACLATLSKHTMIRCTSFFMSDLQSSLRTLATSNPVLRMTLFMILSLKG